MFGAILKVTNNSFKKGMVPCRSRYEKKVMKLLAFIFEQPSYTHACISLYETIYLTLKYLPVITLCMPVDNFIVCP